MGTATPRRSWRLLGVSESEVTMWRFGVAGWEPLVGRFVVWRRVESSLACGELRGPWLGLGLG